MTTSWVIGAGGLLGGHVARRLAREGHEVLCPSIPWADAVAARAALRAAGEALLARGAPWTVSWCAGAGVMATSAGTLAHEQEQFEQFLDDFAGGSAGAFFLASSAGGLYAGSAAPPFDEYTEPHPVAAYGRTKLAMEASLRQWARRSGTPAVIGRIANLYGPGQDMTKPQGLISVLCRSGFTGEPISLYVSLDTLRDYLYAPDCAAMVTAGLARVSGAEATVTKVMASGRSVTVGSLIGETRRVLRRPPRIVFGAAPSVGVQVNDLRLRSMVWPELNRLARTPLAVGLAATSQDVGARLTRPRSFSSWAAGRGESSHGPGIT